MRYRSSAKRGSGRRNNPDTMWWMDIKPGLAVTATVRPGTVAGGYPEGSKIRGVVLEYSPINRGNYLLLQTRGGRSVDLSADRVTIWPSRKGPRKNPLSSGVNMMAGTYAIMHANPSRHAHTRSKHAALLAAGDFEGAARVWKRSMAARKRRKNPLGGPLTITHDGGDLLIRHTHENPRRAGDYGGHPAPKFKVGDRVADKDGERRGTVEWVGSYQPPPYGGWTYKVQEDHGGPRNSRPEANLKRIRR